MKLRVFAIAIMMSGTAHAADAPASAPQIYRLTPAERDSAIAAAALKPESQRGALLPSPVGEALIPSPADEALKPSAERDAILGNSLYGDTVRDKRLHGEVGMFIGTGGARGIYGSTTVPLGETGVAQFSFESSQFSGRSLQPYQWQRQQPRQ